MPGPFPGMDPYTEQGEVWPELHNRLMIYLCDAIQPVLPPHYVARLELRIFTEREPGSERGPFRVPDLELVRQGPGARGSAPVAVLEPETDPGGYWITSSRVERREVAIGIRAAGGGELVTAVELLSPSNKRSGDGRVEYLRKQAEILGAGLNLVEIDLLRAGLHTVAADRESLEAFRPFDYLLCVHRTAREGDFWVYPWTVRERLPVLPIPLAPGDPELRVDLKPLFDRAYDNAACPKLVDYRREPDPPLGPEDGAWADALLREAGLRGDAVA